jgi:hypothetical protein
LSAQSSAREVNPFAPLVLLASLTFEGTVLPDSLGNSESMVHVEIFCAAQDSGWRACPVQPHPWFKTGDYFDNVVAEVPDDGIPRRYAARLRDAAGNLGGFSNQDLGMRWRSAPETLIVSTWGRDSWTGEECKISTDRCATFNYRKHFEPMDAWKGAPFLLGNLRQVSEWAPVHAQLCELYGYTLRGGQRLYDCPPVVAPAAASMRLASIAPARVRGVRDTVYVPEPVLVPAEPDTVLVPQPAQPGTSPLVAAALALAAGVGIGFAGERVRKRNQGGSA